MNKTLRLLSLRVSTHLRGFRLFLLTLLLCGFMQARAETWTDGNGFTWSFTVNGTEATDIKPAMFETHYIYGDPANPEQGPVTLGLADAAAGRFSSTEGKYFPTISGDVYFGLKTLIFDIIDAQEGPHIWNDDSDAVCTMRVMNGWWSAVYADDVPMSVGLWELPITEQMARECAPYADGGEGKDLDLLMTGGSITIKSVYYQNPSFSETELVIPEKVYVGSTELTVTSIGAGAFSGCPGLTSVTIPASVTSIGAGAFFGCTGLTSVTIPASVTSIGAGAFSGCPGLTSVTINSDAIMSQDYSWDYSLVRIFGSQVKSVIIGEGVTSIGNFAFIYCSDLTSVTIPESVTSIGDRAFASCSGLKSVTIPSSVTSIGAYAFYNCTSLTSVTSLIEEPFEIGFDVFYDWNNETEQSGFTTATLYVPAGTKEKYLATPAWNQFQNIVEMDSPSGILINSTTFPDDNFRNWVLAQDYGQDGVLTETEIANVWGIDVSFNNIADLKGIEHFTKIRSLVCYGNLLTSLDISQNTALWSLLCTGNQLTSLDLSKNTELSKLECTGNLLTSLDFSKNTALTQLFCSNNQIDETEMGKLVESLPTPIYDGYFFVKLLDNSAEHNVITTAQVAAARAKGWTVYAYDENWNAVEYDGDEHRELDPINNGEAVDFGTDISEDTNIDGNTVGDIYYSISSGDGSYDPSEGCIVVTSPTDDETVSGVSGTDIFGEDFNAHFTGVVFKVAPGKGTIWVEAQTTGNMVLKVKIGDGEPITMELEGKLKVSFPYNVGEETYVYIYGSENSAAANGMRFAPSTGSLKIYGIEVESVTDGIETATLTDGDDDAPIYNLNGQRVNTPHRGVYIQNGKKVLVK